MADRGKLYFILVALYIFFVFSPFPSATGQQTLSNQNNNHREQISAQLNPPNLPNEATPRDSALDSGGKLPIQLEEEFVHYCEIYSPGFVMIGWDDLDILATSFPKDNIPCVPLLLTTIPIPSLDDISKNNGSFVFPVRFIDSSSIIIIYI